MRFINILFFKRKSNLRLAYPFFFKKKTPPFVIYYQKVSAIPPLCSIKLADDYVYGVRWSLTHPALFGTVDVTNQFDLWNLDADTEEPFVSTQIGSGKALNKLAWDKDSKKTAIVSSDGHAYVDDIVKVRLKINVNQLQRNN